MSASSIKPGGLGAGIGDIGPRPGIDGRSQGAEGAPKQDSGHREVAHALQEVRVAADSVLVCRTQRVVRERALAMQAQRRRTRDIWLACAVCSALLIMMTHSVWSALAQYDANAGALLNSADILDSSAQLLVMLMWFLPVSAAVMAMVVFQRSRNRRDNERMERTSYGSMASGRSGSVQVVR